tara:strand:+ start:106 stop:207 length:102 start_codon:yes stop_codon:yes gene_type:complete
MTTNQKMAIEEVFHGFIFIVCFGSILFLGLVFA